MLREAEHFHVPDVLDRVETDIDDAVAVIHGDAVLPERAGYAAGTYTSDVSQWLVAWAFGVEMDPHLVAASDALTSGHSHDGEFFSSTPDASGTEVFLAWALDRLAKPRTSGGEAFPSRSPTGRPPTLSTIRWNRW